MQKKKEHRKKLHKVLDELKSDLMVDIRKEKMKERNTINSDYLKAVETSLKAEKTQE